MEDPRKSSFDVEGGRPVAPDQYYTQQGDYEDAEHHSLLPKDGESKENFALAESPEDGRQTASSKRQWISPTKGSVATALTYGSTFIGGILITLAVQNFVAPYCGRTQYSQPPSSSGANVASPTFHFPPSSPTNRYPDLFPTNVGFAGPTPTGAEAGLVATAPAYPVHTGAANLVGPTSLAPGSKGKQKAPFDIFKHWGNLSPWYSVPSFGLNTSPEAPEGCRVTGLHFLHRHGARYPTSWSAPSKFAQKFEDAKKSKGKISATGDLDFLNDWTYKLGGELLTPFGRQQMFDLGINLRIKYGFLLNNFTDALPVFRTESEDRMLHSALNFAVGFFGYPIEGQYQQSITYETQGVNNTLAPYMTCPNSRIPAKADRGVEFVGQWASRYLQDALARLKPLVTGLDLTIEDIYIFQQMCAYETVALGYSKFCELFTEEEWEGFGYALDLYFWYNSGFGSPVARVQGIGYIQELVARLTHTPISVHNSSTNSTLDDNPITFPLHQSLYVDATHEVVVVNIITALNLSNFAATGPLPSDHIPANRSFISSQLAPFGTNMQFQLLSCASTPDDQIRIIINDGVSPLTGIQGCPEQKDGMCPVKTFVEAQKKIIAETDWEWDCNGDWQVLPGDGWSTTTGDPPKKGDIYPPGSKAPSRPKTVRDLPVEGRLV